MFPFTIIKNNEIFGIRPQITKNCSKIENRPLLLCYESIHDSKTVFVLVLVLLDIDFYSFEVKLFKVFRRAKKHKYIYIHMSMYVNVMMKNIFIGIYLLEVYRMWDFQYSRMRIRMRILHFNIRGYRMRILYMLIAA